MSGNATVKVSKELRDRINANARDSGGMTVDAYLRTLLDRDEWQQQLDSAAHDMRDAGSDIAYQEEVAEWDSLPS